MSTTALLLDPSYRNRPFRMANSMVDMEWPVPIAGERVIDPLDRCVWYTNSYVPYVEMRC